MNYKSLIVIVLGVLIPVLFWAQSPTGYTLKRVIIDAGHGGKDPGAIGTGRYKDTEADVALSVSLKVRNYILQYYDSVEVIMTRDSDHFVELRNRTKIANESKADLFISIHCNTNGNKSASGTETYVIGVSKEKSNLAVAKRENQVITLEDNYEEHYAGFDPSSPEMMVGLTMMHQTYLDNSILFADLVQKQFTNRVGRKNRGVKQAGYYVISYTMMPSVLIELGFISNNPEEDFLNSEKGQAYMASAIYRAFKEYKIKLEGVDVSIQPEKKQVEKKQVEKKDSKKVEKELVVVPDPSSKNIEGLNISSETKTVQPELDFRIQVATSTKKLELKSYNFKGFGNVSMVEKNGRYKYYVGHFTNFNEALVFQREVREKAYKDAFMVAFYKGTEISMSEAEKIAKQN
jgi:N-acetylmuramoyl-L-alanine amidase